jgi:hypothetical protein
LMGQIKMRRIRDSIDARIVKSGFAVFWIFHTGHKPEHVLLSCSLLNISGKLLYQYWIWWHWIYFTLIIRCHSHVVRTPCLGGLPLNVNLRLATLTGFSLFHQSWGSFWDSTLTFAHHILNYVNHHNWRNLLIGQWLQHFCQQMAFSVMYHCLGVRNSFHIIHTCIC